MSETFTPNLRTFQVTPDLPQPLAPLLELSRNLWWVWDIDATELFRRLDRKLWEDVYHNPVKLLGSIDPKKLANAAADSGYLAHQKRVYDNFRHDMDRAGWFKTTYPQHDKLQVAYFSAEFGLHESLPIYSGGLGVLAGDHLKSASELCIP